MSFPIAPVAIEFPSPRRSPRHIFLSFKTEEREHAHRLMSALGKEGYKVWWQESIQCGREWHGEIDQAVAGAGCIVVLWSRQSMHSPWVRHEASQAIARGVYAPARIEPMAIETPYDRIQATDLMNWTGDAKHPGFINLLGRIEELMPPPISPTQRITGFLRRHVGVLVAAAVAIAAFVILFRLNSLMNMQTDKQAQIATEINRTLQPIKDVEVSAFIEIDASTPGVAEYVRHLRSMLMPGKKPTSALPFGVYPSRGGPNGTEELSITHEATAWPAKDDPSMLYYVVTGAEIALEFRTDAAGAGPADLRMEIGANDPDGSEGGRINEELGWELASNKLTINFTDSPAPKYWKSSQRIVSVPDLEKATLTASILSTTVPDTGNNQTAERLRMNRSGLRISNLFIRYSGREMILRRSAMKEDTNERGLHRYTVRLDTIHEP